MRMHDETNVLELCELSSSRASDLIHDGDSDRDRLSGRPSGTEPASISIAREFNLGEVQGRLDTAAHKQFSGLTFSEFVERRFIPEFVVARRAAGRSHFRAILKHVLQPESVDTAFAIAASSEQRRLKTISGWPYLGDMPLSDVTPEMIHGLTQAALRHGYSLQTATHIRNVIRTVFSHAIQTGCYTGDNPASGVKLPAKPGRSTRALTLPQLQQVMNQTRYPEKEIVLFTVLTEMSVVEICGLQWKYFNSSSAGKWADGEFIPPGTIAIRNQYYRGEFIPVLGNRRRFVRASGAVCSLLGELRHTRKKFTGPHDFVIAARNGSPVNAENIATRRLKSIGASLQMPWLSWAVFQRLRSALQGEFGKDWTKHIEKTIPS